MTISRRVTLASLLALVGTPLRAATPTPSQTEGPFYPAPGMRSADVDNDLVRIAGAVRDAGGEVIYLSGRVLDQDGEPISQCPRRDLAM